MDLVKKKEELKNLEAEINTLEEHRTALFAKHKSLRESIVNAEAPKELTPEYILTSNYSVFESQKAYKNLQKYMDQFSAVRVEGYHPESGRKALKISMRTTIPLEKQIEEIKMFLPYVNECVTKFMRDGRDTIQEFKAQYVKISEPTCSEHGSYSLQIQAGVPMLCKCSYGMTGILKKFDSVDQALTYIHKEMANDY